jgi:hypothetical protein
MKIGPPTLFFTMETHRFKKKEEASLMGYNACVTITTNMIKVMEYKPPTITLLFYTLYFGFVPYSKPMFFIFHVIIF